MLPTRALKTSHPPMIADSTALPRATSRKRAASRSQGIGPHNRLKNAWSAPGGGLTISLGPNVTRRSCADASVSPPDAQIGETGAVEPLIASHLQMSGQRRDFPTRRSSHSYRSRGASPAAADTVQSPTVHSCRTHENRLSPIMPFLSRKRVIRSHPLATGRTTLS